MTPGTVIHFPKFVFHDGAVRDKYLIALGSSFGITVLVKTTSKGWRYLLTYGCQSRHRFPCFHLVQNCCQFPKPTWVCLDDYYEFDDVELARREQAGEFRIAHILPSGIAADLAQCAIDSDDISGQQERIVRATNGL
jgi:hypothetical protein